MEKNINKRDKNEKLIAYCGLYCDDCFNRKGEIADLARDLRKKLREANFSQASKGLSKFFKEFKDYETCYTVLGKMVNLRCKKCCRDGGGNTFCKIRKCSQKKGLDGCWKCDEFESCKKLEDLELTHKEANIKNLRRIKKKGKNEFIKGKRDW